MTSFSCNLYHVLYIMPHLSLYNSRDTLINMKDWTFFTNHGHVLFLINMRPESTISEIADEVGITERAARRILADLAKSNFVMISKNGRKNVYKINTKKKLKHSVEKACSIGDLINVIC